LQKELTTEAQLVIGQWFEEHPSMEKLRTLQTGTYTLIAKKKQEGTTFNIIINYHRMM
jgi:hypothetical protein